ncbi:MAG TPA: hypothetical protein VN626_09730, partial [Clostridia bacterium]|nr:hypothetical protein [Clostridia bacterium]
IGGGAVSINDVQERTLSPRAKTVVCVTDQRQCDRIIRAGRTLANLSGTELSVINVVRTEAAQDPESMEYLFSISKENGAEMALLYANDVAKAIIHYVKDNKVSYLLTGIPQEGDSVTTRIWNKFTHVTFFVVEKDGRLCEVGHPVRAARALCDARA